MLLMSRATLLAALWALGLPAGGALAAEPAGEASPAKSPTQPDEVQANAPPFSEGVFPCSECHDPDDEPRTKRRKLKHHDEQQRVFSHDAEHRWCLDCHDARKRDFLHLTNGDLVPFTESYRLCGQCHGDKFRDWRAGVHGKRVGRWDGRKTYFLCVNCHNPHAPRFQGVAEATADGRAVVAPTLERIKPEPRPRRPDEVRP
jgi:hypothetical protein